MRTSEAGPVLAQLRVAPPQQSVRGRPPGPGQGRSRFAEPLNSRRRLPPRGGFTTPVRAGVSAQPPTTPPRSPNPAAPCRDRRVVVKQGGRGRHLNAPLFPAERDSVRPWTMGRTPVNQEGASQPQAPV